MRNKHPRKHNNMNIAAEILDYASKHKIDIVVYGEQIKLEAIEGEITDEFLETAKQHKSALIKELSDGRWNPELVAEGYVWCFDCQHWGGGACAHPDNPFRTVTKCPQVPRKCQWFEVKLNPD